MAQDDAQQEQDITPARAAQDGVTVASGLPARAIRAPSPAQLANRFTPERARALASARWERYRQAAQAGMLRGVGAVQQVATPAQAYGAIVERQAEAAMQLDDHGRPNTLAAAFVQRAIGARDGAPDRRTVVEQRTTHDPELAAMLAGWRAWAAAHPEQAQALRAAAEQQADE